MAVPIGILLGWLASRENYEGFEAWAILGRAVLPLLLALCIAPILAIASLLRRERHPWLAVVMLVFYGVFSFLYGISLVCETAGEIAAFATFIAGISVPAAWFIWRQKRKDATRGGHVGRAG
jgi:uncharacterized membrane protein